MVTIKYNYIIIFSLLITFPNIVFAAVNGRCSGVDGICFNVATCQKYNGVSLNGKCPSDPENVKCCQSVSCKSNGVTGKCMFESDCNTGNIAVGLCPGPNNYRCCLPAVAKTVTVTVKVTPVNKPTSDPTHAPTSVAKSNSNVEVSPASSVTEKPKSNEEPSSSSSSSISATTDNNTTVKESSPSVITTHCDNCEQPTKNTNPLPYILSIIVGACITIILGLLAFIYKKKKVLLNDNQSLNSNYNNNNNNVFEELDRKPLHSNSPQVLQQQYNANIHFDGSQNIPNYKIDVPANIISKIESTNSTQIHGEKSLMNARLLYPNNINVKFINPHINEEIYGINSETNGEAAYIANDYTETEPPPYNTVISENRS